MTLLTQFENKSDPFDIAVVEIDLDPAAERYLVVDRLNFNLFWHGVKPMAGNAKVRVPLAYTTNYNLMVLMFDEVGVPSYFVVGADKVQANIVNGRAVSLNP